MWLDTVNCEKGSLLPIEVSQALARCKAFCILVSRHSMESRWVQAELSAAFDRWTRDPGFRLLPIVLDKASIPMLLRGMNWIDFEAFSLDRLAETIPDLISPQKRRPQDDVCCSVDWEAFITAVEEDQFTDDTGAHQYGGWSRSFDPYYIPLAFPHIKPEDVASSDSVTHTYWAIRGLRSLQRILSRSTGVDHLLPRIELMLALASQYLQGHFDGQAAGVFRYTTQGETFVRSVRHSATFAKGLLCLGIESGPEIQKAVEHSLTNFDITKERLPSHAEVYCVSNLAMLYQDIMPTSLGHESIIELRSRIESAFLESIESEGGPDNAAGLLVQQGQEHWSPFYTWWVLDACGEQLLQAQERESRRILRPQAYDLAFLVDRLLKGLDSLGIVDREGHVGYPISKHGSVDPVASARIGEVFLRLCPVEYRERVSLIRHFVAKTITSEYIQKYVHRWQIWAIPCFFERYLRMRE